MVNCVIKGCQNRSKKGCTVRFFNVPALRPRECDKTKVFSAERRQLWIDRINIKNLNVTRSTCVCSKHFKTGKPSDLFDNRNPDWAPSLFLGYNTCGMNILSASIPVNGEEQLEKETEMELENAAAQEITHATDGDGKKPEVNQKYVEVLCVSPLKEFSKSKRGNAETKKRRKRLSANKENMSVAYEKLMNDNVILSKEMREISHERSLLKLENEELVSRNVSLTEEIEKATSDIALLKIENKTVSLAYERVLNNNAALTNENRHILNELFSLKLENKRLSNIFKKRNEENMSDNILLENEKGKILEDQVLLKDNYEELKENYSEAVNDKVILKKNYEEALNNNDLLQKNYNKAKEENNNLLKNMQMLLNDNIALRNEVKENKEVKRRNTFDEQALENDLEKCKFYTGLPEFDMLKNIFDFLAVDFKEKIFVSGITLFQEFLIVMMRLRLNLYEADLGYRFDVHQTTVSRILSKWLSVMAVRLAKLSIKWPERNDLRLNMPESFKEAFGNRVTVIIDCFEVFINRASALYPRAQTWSDYKHHNTIKFLLGITPQGVVSFISRAWVGRTSDKEITLKSGFLDLLIKGDYVLADRGFNIFEYVAERHALLNIPAFTKGKDQLSSEETDDTRRLANVRIHVERVIGQVRKKYTILRGILPIDTLSNTERIVAHSQIDDIVAVCCALVNLCPGIVALD